MRCAECGLYECILRTPLGGCIAGEKAEYGQIITTPNTGHWEIDPNKIPPEIRGLNDERAKITEVIVYLTTHGWTCIAPQGIDAIAIQKAASDLVDAVERYTNPRKGSSAIARNYLMSRIDLKN